MLKKIIMLLLISSTFSVATANEVNVYSARKEKLIKPLLDKFTASTGIKVNLLTGKDDALLERMRVEGKNTRADVLITVDAGRLHRAKMMNLLQAVNSPILNSTIPVHLRDKHRKWFGLTLRARPIVYSPARVNKSELSTYEDLASPKWKGRVCVRSSSNVYNQSMVASMLIANGPAKTQNWAKGLVSNFARSPNGGDRDQIKAVAAGQCDVALANTYYFGQMLKGRDKKQRKAAKQVAIFWPNQNSRGAHVNVSGAGVAAAAKNKDNAIKLIEFLVSPESQAWYAKVNFEYPVRKGVKTSKLLRKLGNFKADQVNLTRLGEMNAQSVQIMDRASWK